MPGRSRCARCARPSAICPHAAPIRSSATAGASVRQSPALPQAWGLPREAPAGYRAVCGGAAPAQPGLARRRAGPRAGRRGSRAGPGGGGGRGVEELPQLLNVLRGDMSLVAPRPDLPVQRDLYTEAQWLARCSVRPGITGLAQALYRSEATHEQRLAADLRYAREMSLWLDLQIMLWSLRRLGGKAAN